MIIKKSIYPGNERQRIDLKWWSYFCTNCNREKSQMATSIINMELSDWAIRIYAIHLPPSCHVFHNLRLWLRIKHGSLQPGGHGGPPDDLGIPPNKKCWKKKFFCFMLLSSIKYYKNIWFCWFSQPWWCSPEYSHIFRHLRARGVLSCWIYSLTIPTSRNFCESSRPLRH